MKLWEFVEPEDYKTVLVWGVGDGRNVVFLASQGYKVTAIDSSQDAIDKLNKWAREAGISIESRVEEPTSTNLGGPFDVVLSVGMVNLVPLDHREAMFAHLQSITSPHGLNAVSVFVDKPFLKSSVDKPFHSGQLLGMYHPWRIHWNNQDLFKSDSGEIICVDRVIAENIEDQNSIDTNKIANVLRLV